MKKDFEMTIYTRDYNEYTLIVLEGKFNFYNSKELKETIYDELNNSNDGIIIDVAGVSSLDSSIIGALYVGQKKMDAMGRKFFLTNVSEEIDDLIKLSGLKFMTITLEPDA